MDIRDAAKKLGISQRHVRRLIKGGGLPAKKVTMKKVIEVEAWDIDDAVLEAASQIFESMGKCDSFGEWMIETAEHAGLTPEILSKRTQVPIGVLYEWARFADWTTPAVETQERIGNVLLRAEIERLTAGVDRTKLEDEVAETKQKKSTKRRRE